MKLENGITNRYLAQSISNEELLASCQVSPVLAYNFFGRLLTRPALLEAAQRVALEDDLVQAYDLVRSLPDRLFHGNLARFAEAVGMLPVQVEAILRDRRSKPSRVARADLYRDAGGFRLLELNVCSAIGGYEIAEQNRALLESDDLKRFVEQERLEYVDPLRCIVETMRADCGVGDAAQPFVALADWPSSFTTLGPELAFMADQLRPMGVTAVPCHVGELERRSDGLYLRERRVDIVYRFFLIEDLLESPEAPSLFWPILDAANCGQVALFTALEDEVYSSKGALALLSDERYGDAFTAAERAFIDRFLPWTRELRDGPALVDRREVDLVPYVLSNRCDLILKPTNLHAGAGIVAGWTCTDNEWEQAVIAAVDGPFIVQRRVRSVTERFPKAGGSGFDDVVLNWGAFLTNRGYSGACVRGMCDPEVGVVGMTLGAAMGACFHVA